MMIDIKHCSWCHFVLPQHEYWCKYSKGLEHPDRPVYENHNIIDWEAIADELVKAIISVGVVVSAEILEALLTYNKAKESKSAQGI